MASSHFNIGRISLVRDGPESTNSTKGVCSMTTSNYSRREFLQRSAGIAGASLVGSSILLEPDPLVALPRLTGASDRVRFGIVGIGMEGTGLLTTAIQLPGVECGAACDLYDGRHELAREIVGKPIKTTRRYKEVQIGAQRTSSVLCAKAKELYASGAIGELSLVEGSLGRNDPTGAWEYPPPADLSPQNLDWDTWLGTAPKKPFDPYLFARWRCWKEYGTGLAGDLLVHLLSGMQFVLGINEPPKRASAFGGIYRWKDGRNTPDVHPVLFEYANVPVYMRLTLGTETAEVTRFMGSKGILELSEFSLSYMPQPGIDLAPSYYCYGLPSRLKNAYFKQWHEEHDPKPGEEPAPQTVSFRGNDYDDLRPHLWNFFQAVRSRKPVVQDVVFGHNAALGCHMANESYYRKSPVFWDSVSQTIKS
jgi:predicted dehydrogenase